MKLLFLVYSEIPCPRIHKLCVAAAPLQTPRYSRNSKARGNPVKDTFKDRQAAVGVVPGTFVITGQSPKCTVTKM